MMSLTYLRGLYVTELTETDMPQLLKCEVFKKIEVSMFNAWLSE